MKMKVLPGGCQPVSPVCLGTAQFGDGLGEKEAFSLLDSFAERGGNFVDTANCYGKWLEKPGNYSEQILGRWLQERGLRSRFAVSSKGGHPDFAAMDEIRLGERELRADLEESLRSLKTDYIDIYWFHRDDPRLPVPELVERLEQFKREGKILSYGVSNWEAARFREAAEYAREKGYRSFIGIQNRWSLVRVNEKTMIDKTLSCMDGEIYRYLLEHRDSLCTLAFTAMGKGAFTKAAALNLGEELSAELAQEYRNDLNEARLSVICDISRERGVSIASLVLAWMAAKPINAVPIASVRSEQQLHGVLSSFDIELTAEELRRLDAGEEY